MSAYVCVRMYLCVLQYECACGMPWGGSFLLLIGSEGGVDGFHMAEDPIDQMIEAATCEWPTTAGGWFTGGSGVSIFRNLCVE